MDTAVMPEVKAAAARPSSRQLERIRERQIRYALLGGLVLLIVITAAMILAPEGEGEGNTRAAILEATKLAQSKGALAVPATAGVESTVAPEPAATVTEVREAPVASGPVEPVVAAPIVPEVEMPAKLRHMVEEKLAATDRARFESDWAKMGRADRIEYLRQLGYDVSGL